MLPYRKPVFAATDRNFPTANMGIPDIVRASEFLKTSALACLPAMFQR